MKCRFVDLTIIYNVIIRSEQRNTILTPEMEKNTSTTTTTSNSSLKSLQLTSPPSNKSRNYELTTDRTYIDMKPPKKNRQKKTYFITLELTLRLINIDNGSDRDRHRYEKVFTHRQISIATIQKFKQREEKK